MRQQTQQFITAASLLVVLAGTITASAGERLGNGIVLPERWPPWIEKLTDEPMPVPYLKNPPNVIPIDVGRQLLVDDFLVESTTLKRTRASLYAFWVSPDTRGASHGYVAAGGPGFTGPTDTVGRSLRRR